jgi:hypothetical protein
MNFLAKARRAHRGELGLGVTFWLWFWLPLMVFKLGTVVLGFNSLHLNDIDPSSRLYNGLLYGVAGLAVVQFVYFGIGVLKSAGHAKSRVWGFLARAAVVIGAIGAVLSLVQSFLPSNAADLRESIAMLNAQLPRKLTEEVVLDRVSYENAAITFHYAVTLPPDRTASRENVQKSFREGMCEDFKAELGSRALTRIGAIYTINGRDEIRVSLTKQDCS